MTILTTDMMLVHLKNRVDLMVSEAEQFRRRYPRSPVYMSDPEPDRLQMAYELPRALLLFQELFDEYTSAWEVTDAETD